MEKIWLSAPVPSPNEEGYFRAALAKRELAMGEALFSFEEMLAKQTGRQFAVCVSSGTAGIHLALLAAEVGVGDVVFCPSFTFVATLNPVKYVGAEIIIVDSDEEHWSISPKLLREAIEETLRAGKKPKAVIAVDLYGMPANYPELVKVVKDYDLLLIEDAAESLGSVLHGSPLGGFGDLAILSFNGNKIITTSGGGAVLTDDPVKAGRIRFLASQAREPASHYEHRVIGYNYRLSNLLAAIGCGQLEQLQNRVEAKRGIFQRYQQRLSPEFHFLSEPLGWYSNRWLTVVSLPKGLSPEETQCRLEREGIETRRAWKPMHLQPLYQGTRSFLNGVSESVYERALCLPSSPDLSEEQLDYVVRRLSA